MAFIHYIRTQDLSNLISCPYAFNACHDENKCNFKGACFKCKDPHNNTLFHEDPPSSSNSIQPNSDNNVLLRSHSNFSTLLSTIFLHVFYANVLTHCVRAPLDSGSQIYLIIRSLAKRLRCRSVSKYQHPIHCAVVYKVMCCRRLENPN